MRKRHLGALLMAGTLLFSATGCKKKAVTASVNTPPPPPPRPDTPSAARPSVATFEVEPSSIERGQAATLRWNVSNATNISIDNGIGTVAASGTSQVRPTSTTTYTLTASGSGGSATSTATVNVTSATSAPTTSGNTPSGTFSQRLSQLQDVFFDYDKSEIRADGQPTLTSDADALKAIMRDFPNDNIVMEGHSDERGSAEYNLALSDRRASSAKEFLQNLGVPVDRLKIVAYGKERPQCTERTEACMSSNRRVHFGSGQ